MKKVLKPIITILIMVIVFNLISSFYTYALADGDSFDWSASIKEFETASGNEDANEATTNIIGAIAVVTRLVGVGVAVIMLIVLAMKYMVAAPGDKADIKKHAIVYVVGAVVLFAATSILEIIAKFAGNFSTNGAGAGDAGGAI